jgi:hypothetical protein
MEHPWLIDAGYQAYESRSRNSFHDILNGLLPFDEKTKLERAGQWMGNLKVLHDAYRSDPGNILLSAEPKNGDLVKALEKPFKGIGHKIAQLIILWFQDVNWPDNQEQWQKIRQVHVGVADIWVLRLLYQFGILKEWPNDHHNHASKVFAEFISYVCQKYELDFSALSQAFWHIGSDICGNRKSSRQYANTGKRDSFCYNNCPANDLCSCIVYSSTYKDDGRIGWDQAIPRLDNLFFSRSDY